MAFLTYTFRSEVLDLNVSVNVILPEPIHKKEKLKTLYLLHGYIGDHTDWVRFSSPERFNWPYRYAIIMPAVQNSYYTDTTYGHKYLTYITEELPRVMEHTFPLSTKGEDRFIGGLSMGGYGALKAAFLFPKRYKKAFSLSGALNINHIREITRNTGRKITFDSVFGKGLVEQTKHDLFKLVQKNIDKGMTLPDLYIACGTEDFLYESNVLMHDYLDQHHIKHEFVTEPGVHDWDFWDKFLYRSFLWMAK
ncbi:MAG: alpha/beta hydrolase family protein [Acholeplasmataceae bacterium]|jgi:S-formylglutathione hydrolase FrmB|nr:alpha/beta hydrolase family protein [Acholeplasmataceae bacterium]